MLFRATFFGLATYLAATTAHAASDVRVTIPNPGPTMVYDDVQYAVVVSNVGTTRTEGVAVTIDLPSYQSKTGPRVLGDLGTIDSRCRVRGVQLSCKVGRMQANAVTTIGFEFAHPQSEDSVAIAATVAATTDSVSTNNQATRVAVLQDYSVHVGPGGALTVEHCTEEGLESFFECTDNGADLGSYELSLLASGQVALPDSPGTTGTWTQIPSGKFVEDSRYLGVSLANGKGTYLWFQGWGSDDGCFEGTAILANSTKVAGYRVCL